MVSDWSLNPAQWCILIGWECDDLMACVFIPGINTQDEVFNNADCRLEALVSDQ